MTDRILPILNTEYKQTIARREDGWVYMCFTGNGMLHSCSATPPVTPPCDVDSRYVACPDPAQALIRLREKKTVATAPQRAQGWKKGR